MNKNRGLKYILDTVENEGFDYAFAHYSNFHDIKNDEFHKLRRVFLKARKELQEYLGIDDHGCEN